MDARVSENICGPRLFLLPNEIYSYDAVHNRKTSVHQPGSWTVNGNNQLTQYGVAGNAANPQVMMSYDANGHTVSKTVTPENPTNTDNANRQYGYNTAERLAQVKDGSNNEIASYSYDPLGRRIRKIASLGDQAGITTFIYASGGLIAEADQAGNITTTYGWMPNGTWGTAPLFKADVGIGSTTSTSVYHYYHNDHLGTSQRLTNEAGMVTWEGRMEAFGKTTAIVLGSITTTNRLRFPGQYEDQETGTYYNYFRDYQPCSGRYTQSDPIGLLAGVNTYAYVGGDPVGRTDPSGLCSPDQIPSYPPGIPGSPPPFVGPPAPIPMSERIMDAAEWAGSKAMDAITALGPAGAFAGASLKVGGKTLQALSKAELKAIYGREGVDAFRALWGEGSAGGLAGAQNALKNLPTATAITKEWAAAYTELARRMIMKYESAGNSAGIAIQKARIEILEKIANICK